MPTLQQLTSSQASPEVPINENFETLSWSGIFGKRQAASSGLTWAFHGGYWGGTSVSDGTVTLTNAATNYVVALRSSGAVSVSTSATNWNDTGTYARLYQLTTAGNVVTATQDHRAGAGGAFGVAGVGLQERWVPARDMTPSASGGCAALATVAVGANQPDIQSLDFDATTAEFAQFAWLVPKRWNRGTITFAPVWSHGSTTTNFGVVFQLQGVAVSNDDTIAVSYGTAQTSTDTGGTSSDLYIGPQSAAITIAGTPAAGDVVFLRISRDPTAGSDTLAIDARLHGVVLYWTAAAPNDL
jgi:hypothetical protein